MQLFTSPLARIVSHRQIAEGERIPRFYGVAWYLPYSHASYCLPLPLNWIAGWWRTAWLRLQRGPDDPLQEARRGGYSEGYSIGRSAGEDIALRRVASIYGEALKGK